MTPIRLEGDEDDNGGDEDDNDGDTDEDEDEGSTPVPRTMPRVTMCVSHLRFVPYSGSLPSRNSLSPHSSGKLLQSLFP
jgi:hypothetical protein